MKRIGYLAFFLFMCFFWVFASIANSEEGVEDHEERIIHIHQKSSQNEGHLGLIVPSALEDVESLAINPETKQWMLFRRGIDPIELERVFQPPLPWDLPQDHFIQYINAHNFFLKQLSDGTYKVEMRIPGLGGGKEKIAERKAAALAQKQARAQAKIAQKQAKAAQTQARAAQRQTQKAQKLRGLNNPNTPKITREKRWLQLAKEPNSRLSKQLRDHVIKHKGKRVQKKHGQELTHRAKKPACQGNDYREAVPKTRQDHRNQHKFLKEDKNKTTISRPKNSEVKKIPFPKDTSSRYNPPYPKPVVPKVASGSSSAPKATSGSSSAPRGGSSGGRVGGGGGGGGPFKPGFSRHPWGLLNSSTCALDLAFPEGPLHFPYEAKMVAGRKRAVVDYARIIRMPQTMPPVKDILYVQVNDAALDPEPLRQHLTEETLDNLPEDGMAEYAPYLEWVQKTDHANGICGLIKDACPENLLLHHQDVTLESGESSLGVEDACRNNVHLLNLSVTLSTSISDDFKEALRRARRQGIGIVVAAGNNNQSFYESPFHKSLAEFALAEMDGHLLFVTGTEYTFEGKEVKYANGNMPFFAAPITLSAPAAQIHVSSARIDGEEVSQGTSLSNAMVIKAATRLKAEYFDLSIKEIFQLLREGARKTYLGLTDLLPPDIFGCGVLDTENTRTLVQKNRELEGVAATFKYLRGVGNQASDEELVAYLLKDKGWNALSVEEQTQAVAKTIGGVERLGLKELLNQQNYSHAYRSIKDSGNTAPDEEIVGFLLKSKGDKNWDSLSPDSTAWAVDKVRSDAEKSGLKEALRLKNYPQLYRSIKASENTASDEEIVGYLFKSNGYASWDSLPSSDKAWAVRKVTQEAEERTLEEFLDKKDYSPLYRSIKGLGNTASDEEIVRFILKSNGYTGWDRLAPPAQARTVDTMIREAKRRALVEFLNLKDYSQLYRSIKASGNTVSDEEIVGYLFKSDGYAEWGNLSPEDQTWAASLVTREAEGRRLEDILNQQDYSSVYRSIKGSGNTASDEEILSFILKSNGYTGWEKVFPHDQAWAVDSMIRKAKRRALVEFLNLKDYPQLYRSIKASGNTVSDEEIVGYLFKSDGYAEWGNLSPEDQAWVASLVTREAEGRRLEDILNQQDYSSAYRSIKTSGNMASDEEIVSFILKSNGYTGWEKLFPHDQAWAVSIVKKGAL